MRKIISTTLLIYLLIFSINRTFALNNEIGFPNLHLLKMDSSTYLSNKDLKENWNTVFINFSPVCEHCQHTIKSILENISKFKETQFILTSFENFESIQKFYFDNGLGSFTTLYIGQEVDYNLTKQLKYSSFPCLILFNKEKKFIKKIDGATNAKLLQKFLKN